jgi:tetratricopeptide (TPR) repeat protein
MLSFSTGTARAQSDSADAARILKEGNELLSAKKAAEALEKYDAAAKKLPGSAEVAYNRGLALYRLGRLPDAEKAFQDAARPERPDLEPRARYNLGRTAHAEAMGKTEQEAEAINDLNRAIRFYDEALKLSAEDGDARRNRELAERMRVFLERRLEEKKKQEQPSSQPSSQPTSQPQENQPSSQPSDQQNPSSQPTSQPQDQQQQPSSQPTSQPESPQQPQSQPSSQPQDQQSGEQEQSGEQGEEGEEKQQGEEASEDESKGEKDEKKAQQPKEGEDEDETKKDQKIRRLSPEDAERYLQQARDKENRRRAERRALMMRYRGRIPVEKDW